MPLRLSFAASSSYSAYHSQDQVTIQSNPRLNTVRQALVRYPALAEAACANGACLAFCAAYTMHADPEASHQ